MKKIIIAQRHHDMLGTIETILGEEVSKNTFFTDNIVSACNAVPSNKPYLLITGTVFNTADDGAKLCQAARNKNPNGKVVLFTTMVKHAELFDAVIDKYTQSNGEWAWQLNDLVVDWLHKHT